MPQFDAASFPSQLLWLAVTFVALYFFLRRAILPGIGDILDKRQERIRSDLDKAGEVKEEAQKVREAYEQSLAEGRAEAQKTIRAALDAAAQAAAKKHEELAAKIAGDIAAAESRIDQARLDALDNIRAVAGDLARDMTERLVGLKSDEAAAQKAVAATLKERG